MPVLFWVGLAGAVCCAMLNWYAVYAHSRMLEYVCKPLVITFLLLVLWTAPVHLNSRLALWGTLALLLSLIGDVFLMLPNPVFFMPGLLAFLLAHIGYIVGFNALDATADAWLIWLPIAVLALLLLRPMLRHIRDSGQSNIIVPVAGYGLILSTMFFSSWSTLFQPTWTERAAIWAVLGGTFFFASDVLLGWDRFVKSRRVFQVAVIVTYHIAQMCLVAAVCLYG